MSTSKFYCLKTSLFVFTPSVPHSQFKPNLIEYLTTKRVPKYPVTCNGLCLLVIVDVLVKFANFE